MEILIIGKLWPEPTSSAAGKRMLQLIELLQGIGHVHFACPATKTGNEENLEILKVATHAIMLNNDSFNEVLQQISPSIVVFDRFMTEEQFSWRVAEVCPSALRILNTEDLHFLRNSRKSAIKNNQVPEEYSEDALRELAAISRSDISLIISSVEMELLEKKYQVPSHLLMYLPIFSQGILPSLPSFEDRKDAIFIGNFLHEPNVDAVRYLKNEIWPRIIRENKEVTLNIYGAYPTKEILDYHNVRDRFIVHGRCEDAQLSTKSARLSIAPLRFGAGIKGKILEAMECGTPLITTPIGAEGISTSDNWPGCIATTPEALANDFLRLYTNSSEWNSKQKLGVKILESQFKKEDYSSVFEQTIQQTLTHLDPHRKKHFVSKLIWHQSLQGTKYMSKWIMAKNQKGSNETFGKREKEEGD